NRDLLSAPRRGEAVPNKAGTLAIFHSSTYSFDSHSKTSTWSLLNLDTGATSVLFNDTAVQEVAWLNDDSILYINETNPDVKGGSQLWLSNCHNPDTKKLFASLNAPVSNLKPVVRGEYLNFVVSALSTPSTGEAYNAETAPKKYTSGLSYESLFVRHWDSYIKPQRSSLFTGPESNSDAVHKQLMNLLGSGSKLETPVAPFGGAEDFTISPDGDTVAFLSKSPDLNPANNTQTLLYTVPFSDGSKPCPINPPEKKDTDGNLIAQGASSSPVYSPDGKYIAYLQMYQNGYESDQNKIFLYEISSSKTTLLLKDWDNSPSKLVWAPDSAALYIVAENNGRGKLFKTGIVGANSGDVEELISENSVNGVHILPTGKLLISKNSLTSSTGYFTLDPSSKTVTPLLSPVKVDKELSSLEKVTVEDFSFKGADDVEVHGLITKPSNFDAKKKWKMAFFIHGGPQGAWTDSWSTRWNPAVFAEHGYVVVAVNPTGSTGYGQKFVDGIQGQWGGRPYIDLEKAFEYLEKSDKYSYIDFDNSVALGASYGGYMINYIQGKPLGRKFKALVCHDGVFSTLNQYSSEELYFPQHDFEGKIWENRAGYSKWDPAALVTNWATPQLVIHNELDYRLPVSEGLAVFNILQELGVPSKFLTFPDENHWVLKPENSLFWHETVLEWIDRWT
ncbi:alpha/beta-hydrolase, partial [Morchella conica CCBAS932]